VGRVASISRRSRPGAAGGRSGVHGPSSSEGGQERKDRNSLEGVHLEAREMK
jgi:hypothetical protein